MAGFINVRIPLLLRRAITMIPAIVVLAVGVNPTNALVLSQVVLSFGIPFALDPAGACSPAAATSWASTSTAAPPRSLAWGCAVLISALNVFLLYQQFFTG